MRYEEPIMEIIHFEQEDVIATSGKPDSSEVPGGGDDTGNVEIW